MDEPNKKTVDLEDKVLFEGQWLQITRKDSITVTIDVSDISPCSRISLRYAEIVVRKINGRYLIGKKARKEDRKYVEWIKTVLE